MNIHRESKFRVLAYDLNIANIRSTHCKIVKNNLKI